jgi:hypothetical protein
MKTTSIFAGAIVAILSLRATGAGNGTDPVTKLPLPSSGAPLALFDNPNRMDDVPVCKSTSVMNFYSVRTGMVSAAVAWYAAQLPGFKHVHGMGSGRSQDTFYNPAGTLIVAITGSPGAEGQDTKAYSVIYGTIQPGAGDKVIAGMNIQKVVCP